MTWTSEPPTKEGWYFYKCDDGFPERVGYVALATYVDRNMKKTRELYTLYAHPGKLVGEIIADLTAPHLWAGPIPEPEKE